MTEEKSVDPRCGYMAQAFCKELGYSGGEIRIVHPPIWELAQKSRILESAECSPGTTTYANCAREWPMVIGEWQMADGECDINNLPWVSCFKPIEMERS